MNMFKELEGTCRPGGLFGSSPAAAEGKLRLPDTSVLNIQGSGAGNHFVVVA